MLVLIVACSKPTPTSTVVLTATAETPSSLSQTISEMLQGDGTLPDGYVDCAIGPFSFYCPGDWSNQQEENSRVWASNQQLLEGFAPGESGGQIQVSLFGVLDQQAASPEAIMQNYLDTLYPQGIPTDQILEDPVNLVLDGADVTAIAFYTSQDDPQLINVLFVLEKAGRIATISVATTLDTAGQLLPDLLEGIGALTFDVEPYGKNPNYLLPAGNTYSELGVAKADSLPNRLFTEADQAVFIEIIPMDPNADIKVELKNITTDEVVASGSERSEAKYLFAVFQDPGEYGYLVSSNDGNDYPYRATVITTQGVTVVADSLVNVFACRIAQGKPLTYLALVNPGEVIDLSVLADTDDQNLLARIFLYGEPLNPLASISDQELESYTFIPPQPDQYLIVVEDQDKLSGSCLVTINYAKAP